MRTEVQVEGGLTTWVYDGLSRVTSEQGLFGQVLTYTLDAVGNTTRVDDSQGGVTTSVYNAVNLLTERDFGGVGQTPLRMDLTYTVRNQVSQLDRYSDLAGTTKVGETDTTYDDAGRTTQITHKDGSGSVILQTTYTYDLASRLETETIDGSTHTLTYDAVNQLTDDGVASYSYDANGNRTMTGYQTGPGNQLTNDGVYTYTYDNEGNLSKKSKGAADETWTFSYDQRNQLVGVDERATDGGTLLMRATYTYDVFGNRIQKDVWDGSTTTTTRYGVDGWKHPVDGFNQPYPLKGLENFEVWAELDGSNALLMRRLFGDGIDQPLARIDGAGTASWYHQDRLGSVVGITDNSGTLIDNIVYDAFLNVTRESSPSNGDDIRGTGRLHDAETGLQRHGARMYDSWTGRWIEQDPDRFRPGDANLSRYVGNSPTNATDPSGLQVAGGIGGAVRGAVGGAIVKIPIPTPPQTPVAPADDKTAPKITAVVLVKDVEQVRSLLKTTMMMTLRNDGAFSHFSRQLIDRGWQLNQVGPHHNAKTGENAPFIGL